MSSSVARRVVIAGGGVAGLTLALALKRACPSIQPIVFEQAKQLLAVGAGLALAPNGLSILDSLGLLGSLREKGCPAGMLRSYNAETSSLMNTLSFASHRERHNYELLLLKRSCLQDVLLNEMNARGIEIHCGHRVVAADELPNGKIGVRISGSVSDSVIEADLVVAADGLRSQLRKSYFELSTESKKTAPVFAGLSCVFGVSSPVSDYKDGDVTWVFGKGKVYGRWALRGGEQFWFLAQEELDASSATNNLANTSAWTATDVEKDMRQLETLFHPYNIAELMKKTQRSVKFSLYETTQEAAYSKGRVLLIGDSSHPMVPYAGQGANMAIEDAATLANLLASNPSSDKESLVNVGVQYGSARSKRVANVAKFASIVGTIQTSSNPIVRSINLASQRFMPQLLFERTPDWLYQHQLRVLHGV